MTLEYLKSRKPEEKSNIYDQRIRERWNMQHLATCTTLVLSATGSQANTGGCFQCKPPVIQDQLTLKRNHQPVVKNADHHLLSLCSAISGVLEEPDCPTDMQSINTPQ